jgi:hypothetical protein
MHIKSEKDMPTSTNVATNNQTLTDQQLAIIHSQGNLTINAVAGSGKTTTVIEYAASRPGNTRILYLAFNRSVKLEAARKFSARGLTNVKVETAHSLAYKYIVFKHDYKVKAQGYKTSEIVELKKRELQKDAYKPWTPDLDNELKELYEDGWSIGDLTTHFKRTKGAIVSRLKKLNYFLDWRTPNQIVTNALLLHWK